MNQQQYDDIMKGADISYGIYNNLTLKEKCDDGKHVVLLDKFGNEKKIYVSLFLKYARTKNLTST